MNTWNLAQKKALVTGGTRGIGKAVLTRSFACEWAQLGIRANSISPWFTETPLTANILADEAKLAKILSRTPLKRIAKDEEIAAAVAFLCMDKHLLLPDKISL